MLGTCYSDGYDRDIQGTQKQGADLLRSPLKYTKTETHTNKEKGGEEKHIGTNKNGQTEFNCKAT